MTNSITVLGFVAGAITSLSIVPQIYQIWKKKSAKDVSYRMYLVLSLGVGLWMVFGILKEEIAIIVTNGVSLFLNGVLIFLKWKFRKSST